MAVEERALSHDTLPRRLSSDVTQESCKISDYHTFEQEEMPYQNKMKNRKIIVITFCIANLCRGYAYSLVMPFYATEVRKRTMFILCYGIDGNWRNVMINLTE